MSSSKKNDPYRDFAAGVYLSEAQNPIPPPSLTHCMRVPYIVYLFTHGKGVGGKLYQREGERGNSSQSRVENTNMTACISIFQSINPDKHLPRSYY
jgi:hypothetical protein